MISSDIAAFARAYILISFIDRTSSRTAGQSQWDLLLLDSDNPRGGVMGPLRPPEKACCATCRGRVTAVLILRWILFIVDGSSYFDFSSTFISSFVRFIPFG